MSSRLPTEEETWTIVRAFFSKYGIVRHQIESFNNFLHHTLPHIINESSEVRASQLEGSEEHVVSLCNVSIQKPTTCDYDDVERPLDPHLARLRGLTYTGAVLVDAVHDIYVDKIRVERRVFREVCLCRLPIMLGSSACHTQHREQPYECKLDQGGYFIVSGGEKVLVAQEKLHHNVPYVFPARSPSRFTMTCEVRSCNERKLRSTSSLYLQVTSVKPGEVPEILVSLPFVAVQITVLGLFRLLGLDAVTVMEMLVPLGVEENNLTMKTIVCNDSMADMSVGEIREFLGKDGTREMSVERRERYIDHILNCELLPHQGVVPTDQVLRLKGQYLAMMVGRLMRVYLGEDKCDDRDHYATKRVDCSGTQFGLLFRQVFRNVLRSLQNNMYKSAEAGKLRSLDVGHMVAGKKITQAIRFALATGNWGILSTKGNTAQNGVSQQLSRMTVPATLSLLRKLATPVAKETKNPKPRQLHPTSWGLVCPMDTPEGAGCGLTKSLAMMVHVRVGTFSECIVEQLEHLSRVDDTVRKGVVSAYDASPELLRSAIPIMVNGVIVSYAHGVQIAEHLAKRMRSMRRDELIPFDSSVSLWQRALRIDTDSGCMLRPLLRVDRLKEIPRIVGSVPHENLIDTLFKEGVFEYIDKQEEEELRVCLSPLTNPADGWDSYTHCEFDPTMITGLCGGCIPFADLNQSPRNTYQSAMMKQAVGVYSSNHLIRMDTIAQTMVCPQRPIVTTRLDSIVGVSDAPAGVNVIVAIMCYTGQNQEDSVIINEAALQRGMFRTVKLHTYRDEEHQHGGSDAERFENVGNMAAVVGKRDADYSKLDSDGIARLGSHVRVNDVIMAKTVTTTEIGEGARKIVKRDKSTVLKHDSGIVDAVLQVRNSDGTRITKVRIRDTRTPCKGDKFSSRMGQKGVVGSVLPPEDMPYTEDGIVPDIIVNPHAIPSRMTIGQLCECLLGILCTRRGQRGDGTMFRGSSLEYICEQLEKEGYDRHGRVRMYNGFTGEPFESKIFLGPTYYQRLRHMAADKDHARGRGPVMMLSRQPTEGRARDGGLRFGEMERDALIAHGASEFLKDRLLDNSDPSMVTVCGKCGFLARPAAEDTNVRHKTPMCKNCDSGDDVKDMHCPFAFRLLLLELMAMNVAVRFEM